MYSEKTGNIIENRFPDLGICTTIAATSGKNIPECDPMLCQPRNPYSIGKVPIDIVQGFYNMPEVVLRVPIVLFFLERLSAGKTSENENLHRFTINRKKTPFRTCIVHIQGGCHSGVRNRFDFLKNVD
jgi:hypothetical protein